MWRVSSTTVTLIDWRCSGNRRSPLPRSDESLTVHIWPSTLVEDQSWKGQTTGWFPAASFVVSFEGITAFFALPVIAEVGDIAMSTTSLVVAHLENAPSDRHSRLLAGMLRDKDRLMRYLLLLLSDEDPTGEDGSSGEGEAWLRRWSAAGWENVPLLELLVRAVDRFPERLDHIAGLLRDLAEHRDEILPDGFDDLWPPIWECRMDAVGR